MEKCEIPGLTWIRLQLVKILSALVKKKAEDARKREAEVAKKKADAVKNKAREREAKKAEAARRKILRKGHLAAQDKMKADIVKAKDKGNFAEAKNLKADLKQLIENQEKELKMPAPPKGSKTPRSKNAPSSNGGRVRWKRPSVEVVISW